MSRTFTVKDRLSYDGYIMRNTSTFKFGDGITVLVGCNGSGKTTLMTQMQSILDKEGVPFTKHYALESRNKISGAAFVKGDMEAISAFGSATWASEGERIANAFAYLVRDLGYFVMNRCAHEPEAWIFLDSLDSGMSIDNIDEVIDFLDSVMFENVPDGLSLHVVIAANAYAFAKHYPCIDVQTGKHVEFPTYEAYESFVRKSREKKDAWIAKGQMED